MDSGRIPNQIIKAISAGTPCRILIKAIDAVQYISVVWHLKIRHHRLSVFFDFHVLAVILTDRNGIINDVRYDHHDFRDFFLKLRLQGFQFRKPFGVSRHLRFLFLCLSLLSLGHQRTDFFGYLILGCAKVIPLLLGLSALCVQGYHFVHQGKLFLLEFLPDILLYNIGILSQKLNINHGFHTLSVIIPFIPLFPSR